MNRESLEITVLLALVFAALVAEIVYLAYIGT